MDKEQYKKSRFDIGADGGNFSQHHYWDLLPAIKEHFDSYQVAMVLVRIVQEYSYKDLIDKPFEETTRVLATKLRITQPDVVRAIRILEGKDKIRNEKKRTKGKNEEKLLTTKSLNNKTQFHPDATKINKILKEYVKSTNKMLTKKEMKGEEYPKFDCQDEPAEGNYSDNSFASILQKRTKNYVSAKKVI